MSLKKIIKGSHNNAPIPTYETNKKQTDQTNDTQKNKTNKEKQKTKTTCQENPLGSFTLTAKIGAF